MELLVDTGSAVTIISQALQKRMRCEPLSPVQQNIVSATGHSLSALGVLQVTVTNGNLSVNHPAIVCSDVTHDFIIGVDFFHQHSLDVRFSTQTLKTSCDTVPLMIDTSIPGPWRVAVVDTVTVPAFHGIVVPASLVSATDRAPILSCGLVEPRPEFVERCRGMDAGESYVGEDTMH